MGITFNNETGIFNLQTEGTSYQIERDSYGYLAHLYYGRRTTQSAKNTIYFADRGFSGNPYDAGDDRTYSLDILPQEFAFRGGGDYRDVSFLVRTEDGTVGTDLRYVSHNIRRGKYSLRGLPAVYADDTEAETLEIVLRDDVLAIEVSLLYSVIPQYDVITRSAVIRSGGSEPVYIEKAGFNLDFITGNYDVITFNGRHAMERQIERVPVGHHATVIGSRRGSSSHQYSPFVVLAERGATEDYGRCYSMSFVYSGGFEMSVEMDQMNQTRMVMGLQSEKLSYKLTNKESFIIPEVILSYSSTGLGKLSQQNHRIIRDHICRGKYRNGIRPVVINSWEAEYFDIDGNKLCRLAEDAAELGIDMLVMDDGWFGHRDSDNSSLGDWYVNEEKLGMSMSELIDKVNSYGVDFGIWYEPEMISEDSLLYKEHPDWAFIIPGRNYVRGRGQLLIDFSRQEVVDYLYNQMCELLMSYNIRYIKWDMNRSINEVYSHQDIYQGNVLYDYVLGLYDFLERLNQRFPDLLIEGCCGGGGRFDAGMMYYTPQIWCSDNTDAYDRLRIVYGTSFGYPMSVIASHVSTVPNHQTMGISSIETRGIAAMTGGFGYELCLDVLSTEEKEKIREQVSTYKSLCSLIMEGDYYRLSSPFEDEVTAWEYVSGDKKEVLFSAIRTQRHGNMPVNYIRFKGLIEAAYYVDETTGCTYLSDMLMEVGLPCPAEMMECRIHLRLK